MTRGMKLLFATAAVLLTFCSLATARTELGEHSVFPHQLSTTWLATEVATKVATKAVVPICKSEADWNNDPVVQANSTALAYAYPGTDRMVLGPQVCYGLLLGQLAPERRSQNDEAAIALGFMGVVHEGIHLTGDTSESSTQCRTMAIIYPLLLEYFSQAKANRLLAWVKTYHRNLPSSYKVGCEVV